MDFDSFNKQVAEQRAAGMARFVVPVGKRLSADLLTPVSAFLALRERSRYPFLLESVEGGEKLARYSFLGKNPYCVVKAIGRSVTIENNENGLSDTSRNVRGDSLAAQQLNSIKRWAAQAEEQPKANIFAVLQEMLDRYEQVEVPGLPRLTGGAVGYLSYDTVRLIERLPDAPADDLEVPGAIWCFYDTVVAFDHVKHQLVLMASAFIEPESEAKAVYDDARTRIADLEAELREATFAPPEPITLGDAAMSSNFAREEFEQAVETAKRHIYEGDIFQVVLSQRFAMPFTGDRFNLYRALRQVNPSPYLFYLDFEDVTLIGSSPEVLVRAEGDRVELLPIAGTRRRGATPEEDAVLETDLLADAKERAEHLMLVDLGRNDLGRVCRYETVQVDRYAYIEKYSHVMHIVSSVSGELDQQRGAMDVLAACFPAGTVSGAPKVRAMEIIDALEPSRRGVYAGAVGYVDFSGTLDTCIAIRTMVVKGNTVYVQAGAGIVADSSPAKEYEETENKARALKQAMLVAAEGLL